MPDFYILALKMPYFDRMRLVSITISKRVTAMILAFDANSAASLNCPFFQMLFHCVKCTSVSLASLYR